MNDWPAQHPSVVIAVDDVKASDTEGKPVSMMQPDEKWKWKAK